MGLTHALQALASRAYLALWNRRSTHNLLGNGIGVTHGHWLAPGMSSVGAGLDSYFEYGLKGAILLSTCESSTKMSSTDRSKTTTCTLISGKTRTQLCKLTQEQPTALL